MQNAQQTTPNKKIKIHIRLGEQNCSTHDYSVQKDRRLKYVIDKFCNEIAKEKSETFFRDFIFYVSENGKRRNLEPDKTITENEISSESTILAEEKPIDPKKIHLYISDFEGRKIPIDINKEHKFKNIFKPFCDSACLDISNTLFFFNDQKIELDMTPKDVNGLENNDIINIIPKNPVFTIFVENVPFDTQPNELLEFFAFNQPKNILDDKDCNQPIKCEIFMSDKIEKISGYATVSFKSKSDAMLAIAKCSKNDFKSNKMSASLQ